MTDLDRYILFLRHISPAQAGIAATVMDDLAAQKFVIDTADVDAPEAPQVVGGKQVFDRYHAASAKVDAVLGNTIDGDRMRLWGVCNTSRMDTAIARAAGEALIANVDAETRDMLLAPVLAAGFALKRQR